MADTVKLIIKHNDRVISTFTMSQRVAKTLLSGENIIAEIGGYDPKGPYMTQGIIQARTERIERFEERLEHIRDIIAEFGDQPITCIAILEEMFYEKTDGDN